MVRSAEDTQRPMVGSS